MGVIEKIMSLAKESPYKEAIIDKSQRITYGELIDKIRNFADIIRSNSKNSSLPIGIFFPNCIEMVTWILAAEYCNKAVVLFNYKMKAEELKYHLDNIDLDLLMMDVSCLVDENLNLVKLKEEYNTSIFSLKKKRSIRIDFEEGDYLCHFTSGTEGEPKAVIRTKKGIINEIEMTAEAIPMSKDQVFLTIPPLYHSFGLIAGTLLPLYYGYKLILVDQFVPSYIMKLLQNEKVTVLFAVPYMYYLLNTEAKQYNHTVGNLLYCFSAGAPLEVDISEFLRIFENACIIQDYGSTETGVISLNLDTINKPKSVGRAIKGREICLSNTFNYGDKLVGEICIKNSDILRKYIYPERLNKTNFIDEFYRTGDLGYVDRDGYIYLVGRINIMINVAGNKVDPVEVENVISKIEGVEEVAVVGKSDKRIGKILIAFVVKKVDYLTEKEIKIECRKLLSNYKVPRKIVFVKEIPKGSIGKMKRKEMEELLCSMELN